ncbi:MAG: DNA repair protein RecO [Chloroflexi bacterium]|nr:DNA repair protein RecO [Acidobacteriota bacterium]MYI81967.1 DNA repair protein RecO [Chloroflexota bacterium]
MPARAPRVTRSEAVVIRHRRFGDSDRIVTLLTPARGKIDAIAKGALRPRSRLAGHLEPLTHAEVLLAHGRNLDIITQAQTLEGFAAIRDDLDRLSLALYLLELADRFTVEHAEADAVYRLLLIALLRLARGDGEQLVARSFELGLLDATGFRPEWRDCAACGEPVSPDALAWSPLAGGVICTACRGAHPEAGPIDASVLKVLRYIQQEPYEEAARVRLTPELASGLERVMHELMRAMAERDLGSARFLSEVRQTPRAAAGEEDAEDSAAVAASAEPLPAYTEPDSRNA